SFFTGSMFAVVGTQDGTHVTITPSVPYAGHAPGVPYTVTLNKGQAYQAAFGNYNDPDLTGTIIQADKPVAAFSGHAGLYLPADAPAVNPISQQLSRVARWGTHFFAPPLAARLRGSFFRVVAATDNTHVSFNGTQVATLNRGQYYTALRTDA